jgi:UDP-N-acetylmuramoyl-tripeptide--D-alanyl-D-alanine ligase
VKKDVFGGDDAICRPGRNPSPPIVRRCMDPRSLQFVADACEGELLSGSARTLVRRVCTDSRRIEAGDLFVALVGDKFDAHDFLGEVAQKRPAAFILSRNRSGETSGLPGSPGVIAVKDTRLALGKLAARYRQDFDLPIVVVGGSNGKTTTKELLAAVLRQKFNTLWSEASYNNDVGVPVTLLKLGRAHEAAVLEVGTNHPGEMPPLLRMIKPGIGVLTNIGREHLEFFGDLAGVALEEGWLAELLPPSGKLFVNGDNEWTPEMVKRARASVVKVGFDQGNDWRASQVRVGEDGVRFEVESPKSEYSGEYRLRLLGRHQVSNALLALAAGTELGVTPQQARIGLADCAPQRMRLQILEANGVRILDDAYNANADSMLVALETLRDLPCGGRRVAVLGDMAELGEHSVESHREIGRRSAELGVDRLVAIGRFAGETAKAAQAAGLSDTIQFADVPTAMAAVKDFAQAGDVVLFKASRTAGLEKLVAALKSAR